MTDGFEHGSHTDSVIDLPWFNPVCRVCKEALKHELRARLSKTVHTSRLDNFLGLCPCEKWGCGNKEQIWTEEMSSDFDWFVLSVYGLLLSLTIQCFAKNSFGLLEWTLQVRSNAGLSFDERIEIAAKAFVLRLELILYCWIPNSNDCCFNLWFGMLFCAEPKNRNRTLGTLESWNLVLGCTTALILRVRTFSTFHGTNLAWHSDILNWLMHIGLLHAGQCSGLIPDARGWLTGQTWWDLEARAGAAQSIAGFGPLFSEAKGQKKNCEQSWDTMQIVSWHGQQQFNMRHGLLLTWHCSLSCWSCPGQWDWSQAAVEKGRSRPTSAPVRPSKLSPNQQAMLQEQCAESLHFQFFLSSLQLPGSAA